MCKVSRGCPVTGQGSGKGKIKHLAYSGRYCSGWIARKNGLIASRYVFNTTYRPQNAPPPLATSRVGYRSGAPRAPPPLIHSAPLIKSIDPHPVRALIQLGALLYLQSKKITDLTLTSSFSPPSTSLIETYLSPSFRW